MTSSADLTRYDAANQWAHTEIARRSGGRIERHGDLIFVIGAHPSWVIANVAFREAGSPRIDGDPSGRLAAIVDRYREVGHGVHLLAAEHADGPLERAAEAAGWDLAFRAPVMVATSVHDPLSTDAELTWIEIDEDLGRFREVVKDGFAEDEQDERDMIDVVFARLRSVEPPDVLAVFATVDGVDTAAAVAYVHDGVATIAWVATVPSYRGRGLGGLVTMAVAERGLETSDTALLFASSMGEPVYRRLGFRTVTTYGLWLPPAI